MKISLIVAVDENYGIGRNNQLLCHLPNDLKQFKRLTIGKPVIMGRKTFESIGKPLPHRRNIVISKTFAHSEALEIFPDIASALSTCQSEAEVMIIGGASIYEQTLNIADKLYVSHIHAKFAADTFFPEIDKNCWRLVSSEHYPSDHKNQYGFDLNTYEKKR